MGEWKDGQRLEVLTFELQGELFSMEATHVREILDFVPGTEVPHSDPFVRGLINVRGKVVPLADLRIKFGMELRPTTIDTRIVVLEVDLDGEPVTIGIRADKVHEVTEVATASLQEAPKVGLRWRPEFIRGIGQHGSNFMAVLNMERIFASAMQRGTPVATTAREMA